MACIYQIKNLVNGKFYIGSTIRPTYKRRYEHFSELRKGEHCNSHLQKSFNLYKEVNFKFSVIENWKFPDYYPKLLRIEYLVCRELYLVDAYGAEYNIRKETTTGTTGYHHSEKTKQKIREGNKRAYDKKGRKYRIDKLKREKQEDLREVNTHQKL